MASSKNERKRSRGNGPGRGSRPEPRAEAATPIRPGLVDAVRGVIAPAVEESGLWLEDVTMTRAGARSVVRVTVDLPETEVGALGSAALEQVSRAISAALDAAEEAGNGIPGVYVLEVSTPGTSRPLTEARHFRRARTRVVALTLLEGEPVTGRLEDVVLDDGSGDVAAGGDGAVVLVLEGDVRVPLAAVRRGRVEVELKRIDEAEFADDDAADDDAADDDAADAEADDADEDDVDDDAGESRTQEG